ncbi:MAG: polymer-forming cytoskeletal protein [Paracoccaceae bacterium]
MAKTYLSSDFKLEGDIKSQGDIEIDGAVKGQVAAKSVNVLGSGSVDGLRVRPSIEREKRPSAPLLHSNQ